MHHRLMINHTLAIRLQYFNIFIDAMITKKLCKFLNFYSVYVQNYQEKKPEERQKHAFAMSIYNKNEIFFKTGMSGIIESYDLKFQMLTSHS